MTQAAKTNPSPMTQLIGDSRPMAELRELMGKVGPSSSNLLIVGESGTGKELVARMVHEMGPLKKMPFVAVNCGAIPENLIESELFGHKKGSFTGATSDKVGLFEAANDGTLFLDEIGELPLSMQAKLLRTLQDGTLRKVGGSELIKVNVRIVAATNRDLETAVSRGQFREDLYYRLNVIAIRIPALRERRSDIPVLAKHFLKKFSSKAKKKVTGFETEALEVMKNYRWPGNVRELENAIERALTLESDSKVKLDSLPQTVIDGGAKTSKRTESRDPSSSESSSGENKRKQPGVEKEIRVPAPDFSKGPVNLEEILGKIERIYLKSALEHSGGVKKKAAELLGVSFRSMRYRLEKLGVDPQK